MLISLVLCAAAHATDVSAAQAEADALWAQRADRSKLEEALSKYEAIRTADPQNRDAGEKLVRGWYFEGDGYETDDSLKLKDWQKAIDNGRTCLKINPDYAALLAKGDESESSAARVLGSGDVACLYWTAAALGKWSKLTGIGTTLRYILTVKAWITRVGELDSTYFYDGPDRYWGAYYASIPSFAGKDLDKSKSYFDKAIAANPNYLGNHVLKAETWAKEAGNKGEFQSELNWVLAQSPGALPDAEPENEAAQRQAKALLTQMNDLFSD